MIPLARRGIQILTVNCPRCGRPVATASRSLIGADAAKAQYEGICERCITPNELMDIQQAQLNAIRGT
jgi:hypothetical protein